MTIEVALPAPDTEADAAGAFEARMVEATLLSPMVDVPAPLAPSRLYAYASGLLAHDAALDAALASDAACARDFAAMLARVGAWHVPTLAAAASVGATLVRSGENCRIEVRRSEAEPSQVYVIVDVARADVPPSRLFVLRASGEMVSVELPAARDGVIQLLVGANVPLVAALRDVAAEIYLR